MNARILFIIVFFLAGCDNPPWDRDRKKEHETSHQPSGQPYTVKGPVVGDSMIFGDQKFSRAKTIQVKVCNKEYAECVEIPRRNKADETAHFRLINGGGIAIWNVASKLGKPRFYAWGEQWPAS